MELESEPTAIQYGQFLALSNWIHIGPFFEMRKAREPCERMKKQQFMLRPAKFEQLIKHPSRQLDKFCNSTTDTSVVVNNIRLVLKIMGIISRRECTEVKRRTEP